jgi:hypothetical protein
MNAHITLTPSQQRMKRLLAITDRPLTEEESDDLYRALHADYMRQWRLARSEQLQRDAGRYVQAESRKHELEMLHKARAELVA